MIPSFWTLTDFKDRNIRLIGLVCHHKIPGQLFNCMHTVSLLTWLYLIIGWLIWHMLCYMMSPHLLYCFLKCGLVTKMLFRYIIATAKLPNVPKILFCEEIFNFRIYKHTVNSSKNKDYVVFHLFWYHRISKLVNKFLYFK